MRRAFSWTCLVVDGEPSFAYWLSKRWQLLFGKSFALYALLGIIKYASAALTSTLLITLMTLFLSTSFGGALIAMVFLNKRFFSYNLGCLCCSSVCCSPLSSTFFHSPIPNCPLCLRVQSIRSAITSSRIIWLSISKKHRLHYILAKKSSV